MPEKKKIQRKIQPYNYIRQGKPVKVENAFNRNYWTVILTEKENKAIKEGKAKQLFDAKSEKAKNTDKSKTSSTVYDDPNPEWVKAMNRTDVKGIDTKENEAEKQKKMQKAKKLHESRSQKSKDVDEKIDAKKVFDDPNPEWEKAMNLTDVKGIDTKKTKTEFFEVELWIDENKLSEFMNEFESLNDVKFDCSSITTKQNGDVRISLFYRNFGAELKYPEQTYYQLNNVFEESAEDYANYEQQIRKKNANEYKPQEYYQHKRQRGELKEVVEESEIIKTKKEAQRKIPITEKLFDLNKNQLYKIATKQNVQGRSNLKKNELINAIKYNNWQWDDNDRELARSLAKQSESVGDVFNRALQHSIKNENINPSDSLKEFKSKSQKKRIEF